MRGNLADLAATGLASEPTLRSWIKAEPDQSWIIKRGSNGDAYELDLEGAIAAFKARQEAEAAAARDRAESLRQLGLDLGLGGSAEDLSAVGLSIAERRQLLEEEVVAIKLSKLRGELVPYASAIAAFGDVLARFRQARQTFTARLAKRADFTREQLAAIERQLESDDTKLAEMLGKAGEELKVGDGSTVDGDADPAAALEDTAVPDGR